MNDYSFGRKLKFDASGNVLPSANNVVNLGSPDYRWKDLYLSGSTIDLSGTRLSRQVDGSLMVHDASGNYMTGRFKDVTTTGNISSVGNISTNANLGVGTDNPTFKLHVIGDTRIQGDLTVNGTQTLVNTDIQVTDQVVVTNAGTGPALVVTQSGVQPIADFCDETSGNIVMRIANGGNVGIGTSSPSAKLDVNGNIYLRGNVGIGTNNPLFSLDVNNSIASKSIIVRDGGAYQPGCIYTDSNWGILMRSSKYNPTLAHFSIADASDNKLLTINPSGNVGIGQTNPTVKLHVNGAIKNNNPIFSYTYSGALTSYTGEINAWNSLIYDTENGMVSNMRYTAKVPGYYFITATMRGNTGGTGFRIRKNSNTYHGNALTNPATEMHISANAIVFLAVNDYVSLFPYGTIYSEASWSYFQGYMIG